MINLEKVSGLPIELKDDFYIKFNPPLQERTPTFERKFTEVLPVLMDPNVKQEHEVMYLGYRRLYLPLDAVKVKKNHLTYDLTIIPPYRIGKEFNKTVGHYHDLKPRTKIAHPELYEILQGKVLVILQKMDPEFKKVTKVITAELSAGDKIIYPANYGHILVNIGTDPVVTANWLCVDYKPLYKQVSDKQGMAYYVVAEEGGYKLIANSMYGKVPVPRSYRAENMEVFKLNLHKPMYVSAMEDIKSLDFLSNPEKYPVELSAVSS